MRSCNLLVGLHTGVGSFKLVCDNKPSDNSSSRRRVTSIPAHSSSLPSIAYASGMNNILDLPRTVESRFTVPHVPTVLSTDVAGYNLSNPAALDDDTPLDEKLPDFQGFGYFEDDHIFSALPSVTTERNISPQDLRGQ